MLRLLGRAGGQGHGFPLDFHGSPFRPKCTGTSLEGLLLHGEHRLLLSAPTSLREQELFVYACSGTRVSTVPCAFPGRRLRPGAWRSCRQRWEIGLVAGEGWWSMVSLLVNAQGVRLGWELKRLGWEQEKRGGSCWQVTTFGKISFILSCYGKKKIPR